MLKDQLLLGLRVYMKREVAKFWIIIKYCLLSFKTTRKSKLLFGYDYYHKRIANALDWKWKKNTEAANGLQANNQSSKALAKHYVNSNTVSLGLSYPN